MRREAEVEPEAEDVAEPERALTPNAPPHALQRLATTLGNRAFSAAILARQGDHHEGGTATADAAADIHADWETTPNLRGTPPVRDRHRPPNSNVVEDAGEYAGLVAEAREALTRQRERATGYLDARGNLRDYRYFFAKVYSYVT